MSLSFPARLKRDGNINRLIELEKAGCNAAQSQECFARDGVKLKQVNGDFPLLANHEELCRKAVAKMTVRTYLQEQAQTALSAPA